MATVEARAAEGRPVVSRATAVWAGGPAVVRAAVPTAESGVEPRAQPRAEVGLVEQEMLEVTAAGSAARVEQVAMAAETVVLKK
eukprot:1618654-Prymnesium_polylepis.1